MGGSWDETADLKSVRTLKGTAPASVSEPASQIPPVSKYYHGSEVVRYCAAHGPYPDSNKHEERMLTEERAPVR